LHLHAAGHVQPARHPQFAGAGRELLQHCRERQTRPLAQGEVLPHPLEINVRPAQVLRGEAAAGSVRAEAELARR
jgi:hypothetical protein